VLLETDLEVDLLDKRHFSIDLKASLQVSSKRKIKIWIFRFSRTSRRVAPFDTQLDSSILK
jgi:hypothetical protein